MSKAKKLSLSGAILVLGAAGAAFVNRSLSEQAVGRVVAKTPRSAAAPGTLVDPLAPERLVTIDSTRRGVTSAWVAARPAFQYSRSALERGNVEPCATQKVDSSGFDAWLPLARGRFSAPKQMQLDVAGGFDLVIHLNGDEPVRRELIESKQGFALYTLTLPPKQGYAPEFNSTRLYEAIVTGTEQLVTERAGRAAHVRHVAFSAWSAGFVGIAAALSQPASKAVDAVILVDGLHAPRNDRFAFKAQLEPFVAYAKRAAAGQAFMFVSHSSVDPPGFASTTECAHYLIAELGGKPQAVKRQDAMGLELVEYFSTGDLHVRGYAGNDKPDHCAQLAVLRDVFAALGRRWSAPR
jgi:hypothetical protein